MKLKDLYSSARRCLRTSLLVSVGTVALSAVANAQEPCYPGTAEAPLEKELIFETSGGSYWDIFKETVIKPFEEACGVKVTMTLSPGRNLGQLQGLLQSGGAPWDLATLNTPWDFQTGMNLGLFEPLPEGFWDPIKADLIDGSYNPYAVWLNPYSSVIIYNTKSITTEPKGWADFWDTSKFPGARALQDSPLNVVIALMADGVAPADIYPITDDKLQRAFNKLNELRPEIRSFWTAGDQPVQGVNRGDFVMSTAFNGRAFSGIKSGYDIAVSWDQNILTQVWLYRPKGAVNSRAAAALMYYFTNKDVQAPLARQTGYTGALKDPASFLEPEIVAALPTAEAHLATASVVEAQWWADNAPRVLAFWKEWMTTGQVTIK